MRFSVGVSKDFSVHAAEGAIMQDLTVDDPVASWAIEQPQSIKVFEKHGIDYCCGGKSLRYVCQLQGLDPRVVVAAINEAARAKSI